MTFSKRLTGLILSASLGIQPLYGTAVPVPVAEDPPETAPAEAHFRAHPEQREARMAAARKAQPAKWRAQLDAMTKDERRAMMIAANNANKTSPWRQGG